MPGYKEQIQDLKLRLGAKTRELRIEDGLEKVRVVALRMREPADMLKICKMISKQLLKLGVKEVRNVQTAIFYESRGTYMNYEYYAKHDKSIITETHYNNNRTHKAFALKMLKGKGEFFVAHIRGRKVKDWIAYQKTTNVFIDDYLIKASSLNYYWHSLGPVALGISTYEPLSEEDLALFQRFLKVFELAYRRYLDIEKAVSQAREVRIQLALEKVRARTMSMQKSGELPEAANLLFRQVQTLGMPAWSAGYCIWNRDESAVTLWMSTEGALQPPFTAPTTEDELFIQMRKGHEPGKPLHIVEMGGQKLVKHYRYMRTLPVVGEILDSVIKAGHPLPNFQIMHYAYFSAGFLLFITYEPVPGAHEVFIRFAKVFDQTYTRFLDLQKAEAQAKEAQIETALEKVRSRTMAMHKSEELKDVIQVVFEQLAHLKIRVEHAGFILDYKTSDDMHIWLADPNRVPSEIRIPYFDSPHWNSFIEAKKKGKDFFANRLNFNEKNKFYKNLFKLFSIPDEAKQFYFKCPGLAISTVLLEDVGLYIENFSGTPYSEDENAILMRFGKVFQQTYTRFLDLHKAEAQAREAQIEAALEKIRSRSLAMHYSDELREIIQMVYLMLGELKVKHDTIAIQLFDFDTKSFVFWPRNTLQNVAPKVQFPFDERIMKEESPHRDLWEAMASAKPIINKVYTKHQKNVWLEYVFANNDYSVVEEHSRQFLLQLEFLTICFFPEKYSGLYAESWDGTKYSDEELDVLRRAVRVFEQAYVRFLDLQKAEAQAREAQIEAALERVRSSSMAMHQSSDLHQVIKVITEQLCNLQLKFDVANFAKVDEAGNWDLWLSTPAQSYPAQLFVPYLDHPIFNRVLEMRRDGLDHIADVYGQESKNVFFRHFFENSDAKHSPEARKEAVLNRKGFARALFYLKNIWFAISNYEGIPFSESDVEIFRRFAKAFEQSYIRFLDLQKAEAQAREAQIEVALERLRNQSMLMQHSDEINSISNAFHEQLVHLGIPSEFSYVWLPNKENKEHQFWASWLESGTGKGVLKNKQVTYPLDENEPYTATCLQAWNKQDTILEEFVPPLEVAGFFESWPDLIAGTQHLKAEWFPEGLYYVEAYMKYGCFGINIRRAMTAEEKQILRRFTIEFERSYTRFLDLKKAETQARESLIELGLEKVRSRAMAMQKSDELKELIGSVFTELTRLDLLLTRCLIMIYDPNTKGSMWWMANSEAPAEPIGLYVKYHEQPPYLAYVKAWENRTLKWQFILEGKTKTEWDDFLFTETDLAHLPDFVIAGMKAPDRVFLNSSFNNFGNLTLASLEPLSDEHFEIMLRFAKVFDLTYTRFNDLQKAEASAREAVKQASLDRVRAEIASMRSPSDLEKITPLLWKELTVLGLPFIRCGVFIMDDSRELIHTYLSTPDGRSIAAIDIPYHTPGNIHLILSHWRDHRSYLDHWDEEKFRDFVADLAKLGALSSQEQYLSTLPPGGFYLQFLPFLQGMLYIGTMKALGMDELNLVQALAEAFSTAYARYEDFNRLEAAKQQVDKALIDLQLAQAQLVQAEKMASLGELTAGIAHEIQNPLNFVNNFSEVNAELIDEVKQALETGNTTEASHLTENIRQNLEKINFHGKRADGIVKSMLQHSRSSEQSGKLRKEPTDINTLADEYLRLAYHGLRAKDQTFNAILKTDFDPSIGLIQVIPQDIARAILNLITNAFYAVGERMRVENSEPRLRAEGPERSLGAVQEKSRQGVSSKTPPVLEVYQPLVSITTKKTSDKTIEIRIRDNGPGIPQQVLDKIFQPFFTTKPTGQGTGLGLSLAYDIVKAHGGELKVDTQEGEGSTFIMSIPNS